MASVAGVLVQHLPVLTVITPMLAAPLCILFGNRALSWWIAFLASLSSFLFSSHLLLQVLDGDVISYALGGWAPPIGIEYRIDAANALILFLISGISTLALPYAWRSVSAEVASRHHTLFYTCFLLCMTGLMGVVATGDAFNVFVFLEISSLSTYVLVAAGARQDKRALTASYDYLIMGTIGATFFVIGIGFLYMATGTLNMVDMSERLGPLQDSRTVQAGFAFILVGMGLKAAIYPLHLWLPNAYTYAPSVVTVFLAATSTKAAIYVLVRFLFSVFEPQDVFDFGALRYVGIPLAILAMFAASIIAAFQNDLKRMLAYSSIAQIGYMLLGIAFITQTGLTAALVHLFNHGITKAALFMVVGIFVMKIGSTYYDDLQGMGKKLPWTCFAFVLAGISLIGVPGTAGFVSKWVLIEASLELGWWYIAVAVVLSSLLAVVYVWRVVEVLYLKSPVVDYRASEAPLSMLIPCWILAIICIWFGFNTSLTLGAANVAAEALLPTGGVMGEVQ